MKTKLIIGMLMLLAVMNISAHDFSVIIDKQQLYFDIISETKKQYL